jgi:hypothetical protein
MKLSGKKISFIVLAICFVVLAIGAMLKYKPVQNSPELAFQTAWEGLRQNSITQVESAVDIHTLSANVIDQLFQKKKKEDSGVLDKLEGWAERKYASFIRPEMISSLEKQMVRFISLGTFEKVEKEAVLSNLKKEVLGETGSFKPAVNFRTKGMEATAELPIVRNDVKTNISLQLRFVKKDKDWMLVDVPNLNSVLQKMEKINQEKRRQQNIQIQEKLHAAISPLNLTKSSGITEWGVGNAIILQGSFENISDKDIIEFHAFVDLIEKKNKKLLKTVSISDTDTLPSKKIAEKSWPMVINPISANEKKIYELPAEELLFTVRFSEIIFVDGTTIALIKE